MIEVLNLSKEEATEFTQAAHLSHAPGEVRSLVNRLRLDLAKERGQLQDLRTQVAALSSDLSRAKAELVKIERGQLTAQRDQISARILDAGLNMQINSPVFRELMRGLGKELEIIDERIAANSGSDAAANIDETSLEIIRNELVQGFAEIASAPFEIQRAALLRTVQRVQITEQEIIVKLYRPEGQAPSGSYNTAKKLPRMHGVRTVVVRLARLGSSVSRQPAARPPTSQRVARPQPGCSRRSLD